ncbi:hypothetical protein [Sedimenticola hydrogenitrophicus]|uniref:hypothetical protein n=1 Tax=Sedimenticola hydrogenitrophicus TaxID=2967975 RepID=UPI0021A63AAF|nr:hypothetical protein [Sedimenticola hydrogenitrophicus]
MPSVDELSEAAKIAYRAFLDMSNSKIAHFDYLVAIETKYKLGGAPSVSENLELERLLANHDKNVQAFTTAMAAVTDSDEKQTLFQLFS